MTQLSWQCRDEDRSLSLSLSLLRSPSPTHFFLAQTKITALKRDTHMLPAVCCRQFEILFCDIFYEKDFSPVMSPRNKGIPPASAAAFAMNYTDSDIF